jgi:hypothetical protein
VTLSLFQENETHLVVEILLQDVPEPDNHTMRVVESAVVARDTVHLSEAETHLVIEILLQDFPEPDDHTM